MYKSLLNKPELARLVADLTSDGHLQIQGHRYISSFYSKEINEIQRFNDKFYKLFKIKGKIYEDRRPVGKNPNPIIRYKIFFISKQVSLFLRDIGTPVGDKTNFPFLIPEWIIKGTKEMKSSYIRGLFDAEGSIFCGKDKRWQMTFKMAKNEEILSTGINFFQQIKDILSEFNIKSSPINTHKLNIRKNGSQSIILRICIEKPSFKNFLKYISFDNKNKQEKLLISLAQ